MMKGFNQSAQVFGLNLSMLSKRVAPHADDKLPECLAAATDSSSDAVVVVELPALCRRFFLLNLTNHPRNENLFPIASLCSISQFFWLLHGRLNEEATSSIAAAFKMGLYET